MREFVRSVRRYPALSLGGVLLLGVLELVALQRAQALARNAPEAEAA